VYLIGFVLSISCADVRSLSLKGIVSESSLPVLICTFFCMLKLFLFALLSVAFCMFVSFGINSFVVCAYYFGVRRAFSYMMCYFVSRTNSKHVLCFLCRHTVSLESTDCVYFAVVTMFIFVCNFKSALPIVIGIICFRWW
jgi:hypothetical protein